MIEPWEKWCVADNLGNVWDSYKRQGRKIGAGGFGFVFRATQNSTGDVFAIKAVAKLDPTRAEPQSVPERLRQLRRRDAQKLEEEITTMRNLNHPNIVQLFETFEDKKNVYLVMEICAGGELLGCILGSRCHTEKQTATILRQVFSAVDYMHGKFICHRDIKQENILFLKKSSIENNTVKLVDFGLACNFKPGQFLSCSAGTVLYVAPQVLERKYDNAVDLWSCGVLLYIMLCGSPPFMQENDPQTLAVIRRGNYSFPPADWSSISEEAKSLIRSLLKMNPKDRLTAAQALEHAWLQEGAATPDIQLESALEKMSKFMDYQRRTQDATPAKEDAGANATTADPSASPVFTEWLQDVQDTWLSVTTSVGSLFSGSAATAKLPVEPELKKSSVKQWCTIPEIQDRSQLKPAVVPPSDAVVPDIPGISSTGLGISVRPAHKPEEEDMPDGHQPTLPDETRHFVGEQLEFYSKTASRWLPCQITHVDKAGSIMLDVKPGSWIPREAQTTRTRPAGARVPPLSSLEADASLSEQARPAEATEAFFSVGQDAEYLSVSAGRWIPCTVTAVASGSLQIDVKPGYWIPPHHQSTHLRERADPLKEPQTSTAPSALKSETNSGYPARSKDDDESGVERMEYFSMSHGAWIPCSVLKRDSNSGAIMIDVLPNAWLSSDQQANCLRPASKLSNILRIPLIGDKVVYLSASHKRWIPTIINDVNEMDEIELEIKPGVWITRERQASTVRWREDTHSS